MNSATISQPLISINEAGVFYRQQQVLQDIALDLHHGERIALLGKSGAGKSTLLKLLYQQLSDQSQHSVSWIPQQLGLVDNLSVFHNVYMGQLEQHGTLYNLLNLLWPQRTHQQAISQLLTQFDMTEHLFKAAAELSGGQQQRVAIARALYGNASIILADEPVSSLDKPTAKKVIECILQSSQSTVIALHDTELALSFADRIIGIDRGTIVLNEKTSAIKPSQLEPLYDH